MAHRYSAGRVPAARPDSTVVSPLREGARKAVEAVEAAMAAFDLNAAVEAVWVLVRVANRYIEARSPWALARDPARRGELDEVLYGLVETLRYLSVLLHPVMPGKAEEIWTQAGFPGSLEDQRLDSLRDWGGAAPGVGLGEARVLFPRVEAEAPVSGVAADDGPGGRKEEVRMEETAGAPEAAKPAPREVPEGAGLLDLSEFRRADLRVAAVLSAERIPGADKLLRLEVDLGEERRQIVAGVAQHYAPEALVGRRIVMVANLKPARIRGIQSQGMLLAAHGETGLKLVVPDGAVEPGSKVS
jgi:methionyl-tRNA synthetase